MSTQTSSIDNKHHQLIRENIKNLIQKASKLHDVPEKLVLDIGPQIYEGAKEFFKIAAVKTLDIDAGSGADIIGDICETNQSIETNTFDVIICTGVLEHTTNPFAAVQEIKRILKDGGMVYAMTPFNFKIHWPYPDCWRFTNFGLKELFKGFAKVDIKEFESLDKRFLMPLQYDIEATK